MGTSQQRHGRTLHFGWRAVSFMRGTVQRMPIMADFGDPDSETSYARQIA